MKSNAELKSEHKPLILVVDDEEQICASLSSILEDENYRTAVAHNGKEGLEKVIELGPDLVFLDIWMPDGDGIETLQQIKKVSPHTPVIMISGHANVNNALDALKCGALDLLEKPLDLESIIFSARNALLRCENQQTISQGEGASSSTVNAPHRSFSGRKVLEHATTLFPLGVHKGIRSRALAGKNLGQRTLRDSVVLYGQCLHSGMKSGLVLEPLPRDAGIHFAQMGGARSIPAYVEHVESTTLATTLRFGGVSAATIEHLLAALHAYRISNLLIKCNGEVPIFDGSSLEFCAAIESVGIEEQGGEWFEVSLEQPIEFKREQNGKVEVITLEPADEFVVSYELNYPAPVGNQSVTYRYQGVESFKREIAPARTFGFMADVERMQRAGLAAGGRLNNFILIGSDGVINTQLRFPDELARHKVLDAIGDLFLLGRPLCCAVKARMTGHSENASVLRALAQQL